MVIDANIVFAILIKEGKTDEFFFESGRTYFAPLFLLQEIKKYQETIRIKTKRGYEELKDIFFLIKKNIIFLNPEKGFLAKAISFTPDTKDVLYLALALQLNCPLWSNDKRLKEQDVVNVFSTEELLKRNQEFFE